MKTEELAKIQNAAELLIVKIKENDNIPDFFDKNYRLCLENVSEIHISSKEVQDLFGKDELDEKVIEKYFEKNYSIVYSQAMLYCLIESLEDCYEELYDEQINYMTLCKNNTSNDSVSNVLRHVLTNITDIKYFSQYFNNLSCDQSYIRSYFNTLCC